ncbi:hypothetical protein LEN26_003296 [Aphanomyces euteiches]|nr:hypothetical protein LEN26_003296 [Aphanomyces euteiches]
MASSQAANAALHALKDLDVMVSSMVQTHGRFGRVQYIVQVSERGKGHYVVPRRYKSFRDLYMRVRSIQSASRIVLTRFNSFAVSKWQALSMLQFPPKSCFLNGLSSTAPGVLHNRLSFFHDYLTALADIIRTYNWRENATIYNAISRDQALQLSVIVQHFLAIPEAFGRADYYLHNHPVCRAADTIYCHLYPVIQENWTPVWNPRQISPPPPPQPTQEQRIPHGRPGSNRIGRAASVSTNPPQHAALRRRIKVHSLKRGSGSRSKHVMAFVDESSQSHQSTTVSDITTEPRTNDHHEVHEYDQVQRGHHGDNDDDDDDVPLIGDSDSIVMLGERVDFRSHVKRRGSTGVVGGRFYI